MLKRLLLMALFAGVLAVGYTAAVAVDAYAESENACGFNPCGGNPCGGNPCGGNPCGGNPCGGNPCGGNPCGGNPCGGNPCGGNPCGGNPCGGNPCGGNPCAKNPCNPCAKVKGIRKYPVKDEVYALKMGEKLWNDTSLSTVGVSCGTCHPDGAGLKSEDYPRYIKMAGDVLTKSQMINFCMLNPMQAGKVFSQNHQNLTYLEAYIKANEGSNPCGMNPCGSNPCGK